MSSFIEDLNQWGGQFLNFAGPMLWQSSLLMVILFAADFLIRGKIRASIRYALWLVVLVKLCLPPTLAMPTSAAWWLFQNRPAVEAPTIKKYVVTYDSTLSQSDLVPQTAPIPAPEPKLDGAGRALLAAGTVSMGLLLWLLFRWRQVMRKIDNATLNTELNRTLEAVQQLAGLRARVRLKMATAPMSPAVCGLFNPVILLPQTLVDKLSAGQLRAVLLHELFHLRRKDVWVNCAQALLQIVYWWHPLLWLANARIRRVREEAVDDAVMLALRDEAESYAPTLLEVAKLAFLRPQLSLGLVGIMESRSALRQRIERLVDFRPPRKAGLTFLPLCGIFIFSAAALPMGEAPAPVEQLNPTDAAVVEPQSLTLKVNPEIFIQNVKAQATQSLLSPTNDYKVILLDLLRSEGVDCTPPNGIAFNTRTGEITAQNTPDKLEIFREVIEQLNRADGHCELPLLNNPLRWRVVLIEARIYQMPAAELDEFVSGLRFYRGRPGGDDWWSASREQFQQLVRNLESSGLPLIQRPRIQTDSGITAEFFVGNGTNNVEFDCKPYVGDGFVDLALRGTVAEVIPAPTAFTNYFSVRASAEDRGGIVVRVKNYGGDADHNLLAAISVEIATNTARFRERLQTTIGPQGGTATNLAAGSGTADDSPVPTLQSMTFKLNHPIPGDELRKVLLAAGVTNPPTTYFYTDSGMIMVRGSEAQLARVHRVVLKLNGFSAREIGEGDAASIRYPSEAVATAPNATNLFSRTFKVDPYIFANAARNVPGLDTNDISAMARSLFVKLGVDWESPKGKAVFYNDRLGLLFVKATLSDLDAVEHALQALMYFAPEIHIKARFFAVPKGTLGGFGKIMVGTNQLNGLAGILTADNAEVALNSLEPRSGVEELAEPEVTTSSGRQTEMRATQIISIVTNFTFAERSDPGSSAIIPNAGKFEMGPVLDTVATVLPDGYMIELRTTASVTEFLGYHSPSNKSVEHINDLGDPVTLPVILPSFGVRKATANIKLWDGQTVVLGGMKTRFYDGGKEVGAHPDYVLKTKAARGQPDELNKELLVFITVNLVDPAGNRIHSDDEIPFAKNFIPPQGNP